MTNSQDPAEITLDLLTYVKLCHTMAGLYIWEFFTTLDYEWHVIQGRVRYRWTIWIYSLTRISTLLVSIMSIVDLNLTAPSICQVLSTSIFIVGFGSFVLSSLLIILRIIAIWSWDKRIVGLAAILWVVNISFIIYGSTRIRSATTWVPVIEFCGILHLKGNLITYISTFIADFSLLVIMLVGLLRLPHRFGSTRSLGLLLWKQGVIWLLLVIAVESPMVAFVSLDLNQMFDHIFLPVALVTVSIAATRMYRSLVDYNSSTEVVMDSSRPKGTK